jgi:hypothetical protein
VVPERVCAWALSAVLHAALIAPLVVKQPPEATVVVRVSGKADDERQDRRELIEKIEAGVADSIHVSCPQTFDGIGG